MILRRNLIRPPCSLLPVMPHRPYPRPRSRTSHSLHLLCHFLFYLQSPRKETSHHKHSSTHSNRLRLQSKVKVLAGCLDEPRLRAWLSRRLQLLHSFPCSRSLQKSRVLHQLCPSVARSSKLAFRCLELTSEVVRLALVSIFCLSLKAHPRYALSTTLHRTCCFQKP